jgi:drug/metabolite transporter (DMT)-like permease
MPLVTKWRAAFAAVPPNVQGMLWIALSGLIFSCFMALVRHVGSHMDPIQTSFMRYGFGLLFLAPFFIRLRWPDVVAANLKLHLLRGLMHGTGVMLWFYAMTRIPLAEVTAIGFTNPVFATIGAVLFLRESIRLPRIVAVVVGLFGALLIVRPGFAEVDPGAIAMLIAAPIFAASDLCAKSLTRRESGPAVVAYLSIIVTLVTFVPAMLVWKAPTIEEWFITIVIAGLATVGHLCMTQGFKVGEMSAIQAAKFLQLLWSALIGYAMFAEAPGLYTWIGSAIIIASALYIAHRESRARQVGRPTVEPAKTSRTTGD